MISMSFINRHGKPVLEVNIRQERKKRRIIQKTEPIGDQKLIL